VVHAISDGERPTCILLLCYHAIIQAGVRRDALQAGAHFLVSCSVIVHGLYFTVAATKRMQARIHQEQRPMAAAASEAAQAALHPRT
jgi:hypothetical protein